MTDDIKIIFYSSYNEKISECKYKIIIENKETLSGIANHIGEVIFSRSVIKGKQLYVSFGKLSDSEFRTKEFLWEDDCLSKIIRAPITKKIKLQQTINNLSEKERYQQSFYEVTPDDSINSLRIKFGDDYIPILIINNLPLNYIPKKGDILFLPINNPENSRYSGQERSKNTGKPVFVIESNLITNTPWIVIAKKELGTQEYPSKKHNPRIIEYHSTTGKFKTDEIPWCSSFVNWVMNKVGIKGTNNALALSWANWGKRLNKPAYGAIGVIRYSNGTGHVGFIIGVNKKNEKLILLGGNQNDSVKYSEYGLNSFIAFVYPINYEPLYALPEWDEKDKLDSTGKTR